MAVSKEVQYIVQGLRCVFLPPAPPAFGGVAWTAAVLANKKQERPFIHPRKHQSGFPAVLGNAEGSQRRQCLA